MGLQTSTKITRERLETMKKILLIGSVLLIIGIIYGCMTTQQAAAIKQDLQATTKASDDALAQIDDAIAQVRATTQTATAPTTQALAVEKKQEQLLLKTRDMIVQARKGVDASIPVVTAIANGENPGPAIVAAAPALGTLGPYAVIGGTAIGLVFGLVQMLKNIKTTNAAVSMNDALKQAIADGHIVVVNADAAMKVDGIIKDHPVSNQMTDIVAEAPVKRVVPQ